MGSVVTRQIPADPFISCFFSTESPFSVSSASSAVNYPLYPLYRSPLVCVRRVRHRDCGLGVHGLDDDCTAGSKQAVACAALGA